MLQRIAAYVKAVDKRRACHHRPSCGSTTRQAAGGDAGKSAWLDVEATLNVRFPAESASGLQRRAMPW